MRALLLIHVIEAHTLIAHLVPSINNIYPYTKHEKFNAPQIRLFEPCNVDETNGTQTEHYQGMKPSYLFYSPSNADAFQCALRGKILQYTFQVKQIKSAHGFLGSAQPLKLWSDFDGKHQSVSFLQQYARPYCHVDIPLSILATTIYTDNSRNRVTVEIPAPRSGRVRRALDRAIRWMQRMGYFPNRSSRAPSDTSSVTGEQSTVFEDELTLDDVRFLTYLATLKIEFSSLHGMVDFQWPLASMAHINIQTRNASKLNCPNSSLQEHALYRSHPLPKYPSQFRLLGNLYMN